MDNHFFESIKILITILQQLDAIFNQKLMTISRTYETMTKSTFFSTFIKIVNVFYHLKGLQLCVHLIIVKLKTYSD